MVQEIVYVTQLEGEFINGINPSDFIKFPILYAGADVTKAFSCEFPDLFKKSMVVGGRIRVTAMLDSDVATIYVREWSRDEVDSDSSIPIPLLSGYELVYDGLDNIESEVRKMDEEIATMQIKSKERKALLKLAKREVGQHNF